MVNTKSLDLHILEVFVNDNKSKKFIRNFENYKESIRYLKNKNLPVDDFEYHTSVKIEMEDFFYENSFQKKVDEINKLNLKMLDENILNKIQTFEDVTEEKLIQKVKYFLYQIIKNTNKKVDPTYGSIRTIVDGYRIQISYRLID